MKLRSLNTLKDMNIFQEASCLSQDELEVSNTGSWQHRYLKVVKQSNVARWFKSKDIYEYLSSLGWKWCELAEKSFIKLAPEIFRLVVIALISEECVYQPIL